MSALSVKAAGAWADEVTAVSCFLGVGMSLGTRPSPA
jgi:hypothetical protein